MTDKNQISSIGHDSFYQLPETRNWLQVKRYYAMNFDFFEMEPHIHREFEIMYIASGTCIIHYWNAPDEPVELSLREGEYVLLDCNVMHQLTVKRGLACRILNLEISLERDICEAPFLFHTKKTASFQELMRYQLPVMIGYDDAGNLHTIISELHKQLQNPIDAEEDHIMQNLILAQLIVELGRQKARKTSSEGGSRYVRKAIHYLSAHFEQELKMNEIASAAGVSTAYLQRIFK